VRLVAEYDLSEWVVSLLLSLVDDHRQRYGEVRQLLFDFQTQQQERKILTVGQVETIQDAFEIFDSMIAKGAVIDRLYRDWPPMTRVYAAEGLEQSEVTPIFLERLPLAASIVDVDEMKLLGSSWQQFTHVVKAVAQLPSNLGNFVVFEKDRDVGPSSTGNVPGPGWADRSIRIIYSNMHSAPNSHAA
jgi:hypothetical protein